jgi:hypothetical protein
MTRGKISQDTANFLELKPPLKNAPYLNVSSLDEGGYQRHLSTAKAAIQFDGYLFTQQMSFAAVIIGGAALNILDISARKTKDVDCLDPEISLGERFSSSLALALRIRLCSFEEGLGV